jgi:FkbM family methyltransferase
MHSSQRTAMPSLESFITRAASACGLAICRYRGRPLVDGLERIVDRFHRRLNNMDFEMRRNGEMRVLEIVASSHPRCIFDVGANEGDWTVLAAELMPGCEVHAFEVVPETFTRLARRVGGMPTVHANECGLSSSDGSITIHLGETSDTATACRIAGMPFHDRYYSRQVEGRTMTGAEYLERHGIDCVDLLKIDVEGMDLQVIRGFGDRLRDVRVIQFEYGIFNIASHDLLSDFYRHLHEHGFKVGKIFPRGVAFGDYHFNMENFHGSNYLAVRDEESELIGRLAGRAAS